MPVKPLTLLLILLAPWPAQSQSFSGQFQSDFPLDFAAAFDEAYRLYPDIPKGLLEAVSFTRTRLRDVRPDREAPSCIGLPGYWGPMGLVEDGKGWFRNSLLEVSAWSGNSAPELKTSPGLQILAFAEALYRQTPPGIGPENPLEWDLALVLTSELPLAPHETEEGAQFALDSYCYGVFSCLNNPSFQQAFKTPSYDLNLEGYFGHQRYSLVSAAQVRLTTPTRLAGPCSDYPAAAWTAANAANYSSRAGAAITAVTIHTMQGYYAGTISWFQNPSAGVSAHYCLRSSDGQITQMVCEADKAWHVGSENAYTVGLEHEGFVTDPAWYTSAMYGASAALTRDIANDYGINPMRTYFKAASGGVLTLGACTRIKGHQHFPAQTHTDPGVHWNWADYYRLVNEPVTPLVYGGLTGSVYDPGGLSANYSDDQRVVSVIQPAGASSVTLSFMAFDLEPDWDYLLIYDGPTVFHPLLGSCTGTALPPALTAASGAMTLEFRSDCSVSAPGFAANWTSETTTGCGIPAGTFTSPVGWTSATVNWNPVPGAIQYQVSGRKIGQPGWRSIYTPLSAKWLGIFQPSTSYEWRVKAECPGSSWSDWSVNNVFTTNTLRSGSVDPDLENGHTLSAWPVPVSAVLHIAWSGQGKVQLLDVYGRIVREQMVAPHLEMDMEFLPAGWYILRAGESGHFKQQPVLKSP